MLRPGAELVLGFLRGDRAQRNSFPTEVYTFHDEQAVSAMLATSGF